MEIGSRSGDSEGRDRVVLTIVASQGNQVD
jgi:hypothetical protein